MSRKTRHEAIVNFRTQYKTYPGQILFLVGDHPNLGFWNRSRAVQMRYSSEEEFNWCATIHFNYDEECNRNSKSGNHQKNNFDDRNEIRIEYKYIVLSSSNANYYSGYDIRLDKNAEICWDTGPNRELNIKNDSDEPLIITTNDLFQPPTSMLQNLFFKMPFTNVIYRHDYYTESRLIKPVDDESMIQIRMRVIALQVPHNYKVYITGSLPIFNSWNHFEPLEPIGSFYWEFKINLPKNNPPFDYKYLIKNEDEEPIWEQRNNRKFSMPLCKTNVVIFYDWLFQNHPQNFKGSGVLVGLFSVHSRSSMNKIGEFPDIKLLVDWAVKANLLMIQLLPIQDTNCFFNKKEENIFRQVSAFAFNPIYLSLKDIHGYESVELPYERDLVSVARFKLQQLRIIFDSKVDKNLLKQNKDFIKFVNNNQYWLPSYCLWCAIRDNSIHTNSNEHHVWQPIEKYHQPDFLHDSNDDQQSNDSLFHCWVQFQCHLQLLDASQYAITNRIVLSCTISIGQNPLSSECWAHPELFDKDYTMGTPPNSFSFHGDNWYYPAWKWSAMQKNDFEWIRLQIFHKEMYFQSSTFDHPLSLFRSWLIPSDTDNPLFGHFVPSNPINSQDLYNLNITDLQRFYRPIFPFSDIQSLSISESTKQMILNQLSVKEGDIWRFNPNLKTDRSIMSFFHELKQNCSLEEKLQLALAKKIILSSYESVCLIQDKDNPNLFYPRCAMTDSLVFKMLPEREAQILYKLFVDFYYRTNIAIWQENGHQKLCVFANSPMQFFGYDIGISLSDEEKILHRFGICSYHSHRIPREPTQRFDQACSFPYLSVCLPSTQDMPHLSIWWQNEQADVQQFHHQVLKMDGTIPLSLSPNIASAIIKMHLDSNSMWCLFLLEDLFSISDEFRDIQEANHWLIEETSSSKCNYRMGISLEKLITHHEEWTNTISNLVESSKRGRDLSFI